MTDHEVIEPTAVSVVRHQTTSPDAIMQLLQTAVEHNLPVEALERLQALHERVSDRAAAVEFARDLATFQQKCPPIAKKSTAQVTTKSGAKYSYRYAELDQIARTIAPFLAELGLSYTWDSEIKDRGILVCTCTLRHVNGHSVTATFAAPVESGAGMSEQQKHASALTYARRQSLIQVLGLTTTEPDTDGAKLEPISKEQADDLRALIEEVGANLPKFLKYAGVQRIEDILSRDYEAMINAVRAVGDKKRQGGT